MTPIETGLYEQLINKLFAQRLGELDRSVYYVQDKPLDTTEAARYLTQYVASTIHFALNSVPNDDRPGRQIELINKIILLLIDEIRDQELSENLLEAEGSLLEAVINKLEIEHKNKRCFRNLIILPTGTSNTIVTKIQFQALLYSELRSAEFCYEVCYLKAII